jgi:hypothetical protein
MQSVPVGEGAGSASHAVVCPELRLEISLALPNTRARSNAMLPRSLPDSTFVKHQFLIAIIHKSFFQAATWLASGFLSKG